MSGINPKALDIAKNYRRGSEPNKVVFYQGMLISFYGQGKNSPSDNVAAFDIDSGKQLDFDILSHPDFFKADRPFL